jgi:ribosomal protein L3
MQAIIGKKVGMTQVFDDAGAQIPVTVISVGPCVVTQRKRAATDGYDAIQLGYEDQKEQRMSKAEIGHLKKNNIAAKRILRELPVDGASEVKEGDVLTATSEEMSLTRSIGIYHITVTNQRDETVALFKGTVYRTGKAWFPEEEEG